MIRQLAQLVRLKSMNADEKDRMEGCLKVSDQYFKEFGVVREITWKANLALWGAFAGASVVTLTTTVWVPWLPAAISGSAVALLYVAAYLYFQVTVNHWYRDLESKSNQYLEAAKCLLSSPARSDSSTQSNNAASVESSAATSAQTSNGDRRWHPAIVVQFGITLLVCGTFVWSLWSRRYQGPQR